MKKTKKMLTLFLAAVMALGGTSCTNRENATAEPSLTQMRSICELAVMECYYHNVAKFQQETNGILWLKGEKHFWIEYSGIVRYGIDASLVDVQADGTNVTITIPAAHMIDSDIDLDSLNEDSYVVAKDSDDITAEDEVVAFSEAQAVMEEQAKNDQTLLMQAQQRARPQRRPRSLQR